MAVEDNTIVTTDVNPAISIDVTAGLSKGFKQIAAVLGVTNLIPAPAGTEIKRYKSSVEKLADQVAEGEIIGLSKVNRKLLSTSPLTIRKYRKLVTAEAIQKSGYSAAVNDTDAALIAEIYGDIAGDLLKEITNGTGVAANGSTLQAACANLWGKISADFEDYDVSTVYFINPLDAAAYLGSATITTQNDFGMNYFTGFLGIGNAIITNRVPSGSVYATASGNLAAVYIPVGGELANAFGLTYDESGMVGMTHANANNRASVETLIMTGCKLFSEDASKIYKATISAT